MERDSPKNKKHVKEAEVLGCQAHASKREGLAFTARRGEAMDPILSPLV